jgi:membrane protease YdiL (CAAX protease family)
VDAEFALRLSLQVVGFIAYYRWAIRAIGRATRPAGRRLIGRLPLARSYTADEVESTVSLLAATVGQAIFLACSFAITEVSPGQLVPRTVRPDLVALGAVLGVGEASLASFLGYAGMRATQVRRGRSSGSSREWLVMGRGGWMRFYLRTAEVAPWPWLVLVTVVYVTAEEAFFRGILVTFVSPHGAALAVVVSTALFLAVQVFHMPSWRAALFPAAGGLVVGVLHSVLFLLVPDLTPLVVAHFAFFLVLVW